MTALARLARGEQLDAVIARFDPTNGDYMHRSLDDISTSSDGLWPGPGYTRLALRLKVGERGVVRTATGYYLVQRIE